MKFLIKREQERSCHSWGWLVRGDLVCYSSFWAFMKSEEPSKKRILKKMEVCLEESFFFFFSFFLFFFFSFFLFSFFFFLYQKYFADLFCFGDGVGSLSVTLGDIREIFGLGFALSFSNVAGGIVSGIASSSPSTLWLSCISAFIFSFLLMHLGGVFASFSAEGVEDWVLSVVGGMIFILIGFLQFL